jgi:hypothetical protein
MTRVEALENEILKLDPDEFSTLREWLLERDWERWDRQIEKDAAGGRLDRLFERARKAHREGKSREL